MVAVSVLGPIAVAIDGQPVRVPAGKSSELLVRLAVETGRVVRTDRLVEDLWAADATTTSRNTLQSKVARLRRAVGDAVIVGEEGGYRLALAACDVDVAVVVEDAGAAARLLEDGDDRAAADLCHAALGHFTGEILPGAGDADWALPYRARLDATRLALVTTELTARLRVDPPADVVADLEAGVAAYPFQEQLWALLMTALYRAGRQTDALDAYQRVRQRLGEDMGLEPGPQLRRLEQLILAHDPALDDGAPRPRRGPSTTEAGNLPPVTVALVGRERELADLGGLLASERLVEIVGAGGVGKTAVAIATARASNHRDGAWLVRLETAASPQAVDDAVVAALGVTGGPAALHERLRGAQVLIVLDNCEHVVDAAAELSVRLLGAGPDVSVLCTSQVPLDIEGGTVYEIAPLALDDAVELFARRASAQRAGQSSSAESMRELCRALDGLPLAIELAAARTKTLSIDEIARRLDDRFNVLSDPTSRRPERRRALRATIRWSYDLLFPDDQRGLWALATFADGASLSAVESVLAALGVPSSAAIDVVGRLAVRSLVIADDDGFGSSRFRLLDSIRAFALEALDASGLADTALAAHAAWYAASAASSTFGVRSSDQTRHLAFVRTERMNIDAALEWCAQNDPNAGLAMANGFGWSWIVLGDSRGAARLLAALDAAGTDTEDKDRASALLLAGWIDASAGDIDRAERLVLEARGHAERIRDVDLQARAAYYLAYVVSHRGQYRDALDQTDRSRELYAASTSGGSDRAWDCAANSLFAARAAISAGDEDRAIAAVDEVDTWLAVVDDPWLEVRGEAVRGELARLQYRFDDAVRHLADAAETSRSRGFLQTEAYQVASLGRAECQAGEYERGAATLQAAVDKADAIGDVRMAALARVHLGRVLRALGADDGARRVLETAVAWHRHGGGGEQAALGECLLAALDARDGHTNAEPRLIELGATGEAHVEVFALDALARLAAERGDDAGARRLLDDADERMTRVAHFISERDRVDAHAIR